VIPSAIHHRQNTLDSIYYRSIRAVKDSAGTAISFTVLYPTKKQIPWPESANKLFRQSDLRLSAKLVPTLADRGCHMGSVTDPYGFLDGAANLPSKQLLNCIHEAEWTPFQTLYFTKNLVAPGIEPVPLDL
jgi:hypothetical protein